MFDYWPKPEGAHLKASPNLTLRLQSACFDLTKNLHATSLLLYPPDLLLFYEFQHQESLHLTQQGLGESLRQCLLGGCGQMMALLWGQEVHRDPPTSSCVQHRSVSLNWDCNLRLGLRLIYTDKNTIKPALVCWHEAHAEKGDRFVSGPEELICTQGVICLWCVETCVLPPWSCTGCASCKN